MRTVQSQKKREGVVMAKDRRRWTEEERKMLEQLKANMIQDVAARGLKDADIRGASLTFDAQDGAVVAFCYTVNLVAGGSLTYSLDKSGRMAINGKEVGNA